MTKLTRQFARKVPQIFEYGVDVEAHYSPTMQCMKEIEELNRMDETAPEKSWETRVNKVINSRENSHIFICEV